MAQYRVPPDPRKPSSEETQRQRGERDPMLWLWLGLGGVVTLIAIVVAYFIADWLLARPPLPTVPVQPTVIVLTAPPSATPSATVIVATSTTIPTFTPIVTPDTAVAPETVTAGFYARVVNTDGVGVTVRGGPSIRNVSLAVAAEDSVLLVLDGPREGDGFLWWNIQLEDGTEGWAAGDFLEPAAQP